MNLLISKTKVLVLFIFALIFTLPILSVAEEWTVDGHLLTETDIDTAYVIKKMVSVQNTGTRDECIQKNNEDISKLINKNKGDAAIFVTHRDTKGDRNLLMTDAIIVAYLSPEEIVKRAKKAKKPPEFKKESKFDPEPILIEYKDVKFPYQVFGILSVRSDVAARNLSQQAMDYKLIESGARAGANAVLFVTYLRAGADVSGASGIMVKAYDTWEEVEDIKRQDVKIAKQRMEAQRKKEAEKKAQQPQTVPKTETE